MSDGAVVRNTVKDYSWHEAGISLSHSSLVNHAESILAYHNRTNTDELEYKIEPDSDLKSWYMLSFRDKPEDTIQLTLVGI